MKRILILFLAAGLTVNPGYAMSGDGGKDGKKSEKNEEKKKKEYKKNPRKRKRDNTPEEEQEALDGNNPRKRTRIKLAEPFKGKYTRFKKRRNKKAEKGMNDLNKRVADLFFKSPKCCLSKEDIKKFNDNQESIKKLNDMDVRARYNFLNTSDDPFVEAAEYAKFAKMFNESLSKKQREDFGLKGQAIAKEMENRNFEETAKVFSSLSKKQKLPIFNFVKNNWNKLVGFYNKNGFTKRAILYPVGYVGVVGVAELSSVIGLDVPATLAILGALVAFGYDVVKNIIPAGYEFVKEEFNKKRKDEDKDDENGNSGLGFFTRPFDGLMMF